MIKHVLVLVKYLENKMCDLTDEEAVEVSEGLDRTGDLRK